MVDTLLTAIVSGAMNILGNLLSVFVFYVAFALIGLVAIFWQKLKTHGLHRVSSILITLGIVSCIVAYNATDQPFEVPDSPKEERVEIIKDWRVSTWFEEEGVYVTAQADLPDGRIMGGCANETTWIVVEAPDGDEFTRMGDDAKEIWLLSSLEQGNLKGTREVAKIVAETCGWSFP